MAAANTSQRGVNNTAFTPNPDKVAQITGSGAPVPGAIAPTFAAAVVLDKILNYACYVQILGDSAVSATCAVTTANIQLAGANIQVYCAAVGAGTVTYTFGAGFKTSATVAPTTGTAITVEFCSNGTNWIEAGRSLAITT